jgi:aspartate racemase
MRHLRRNDWEGVGGLLLDSANKLAKAGADFLICPANTMHQALPLIEKRSPLPWLHIADAVAAEATARAFRCIGVTGTQWLVDSGIYAEKLSAVGVKVIRPNDDDCHVIDRIILEELVRGVFKPESIAYVQRVCATLQERGCDAVLLGCTELPLILNDSNCALPTLDSTRLLARAALRRAVSAAGA